MACCGGTASSCSTPQGSTIECTINCWSSTTRWRSSADTISAINTSRWTRKSQFADDDVFAAGPIAGQLSATFDEYWNSQFAIPAEALGRKKRTAAALAVHREQASERPGHHVQPLKGSGVDYVQRIATGEPYAGMISGQLPLAR